jgi:hypothetical protein
MATQIIYRIPLAGSGGKLKLYVDSLGCRRGLSLVPFLFELIDAIVPVGHPQRFWAPFFLAVWYDLQ